jgi:predicted HTH transcriptional regulator
MSLDPLLLVYVFLFIFTSCAVFLYYRRIKEGTRGYLKAKDVVGDIVFSFNKDLQRQDEKIQGIIKENEKMSSENLRAKEETNSKILDMGAQLGEFARTREHLLNGHEELRSKIEVLSAQQVTFAKRMIEIESLEKDMKTPAVRTEPIMPIRRESALAPLTETELKILELLVSEGEKTASKIRERIGLTREHTARLMKSLYSRGYIERRTDKMPYVYRLKDEMKDILTHQNTEA